MFTHTSRMLQVIAALMLSTAPAQAKDERVEEEPLLSFVVGDYVIVGREPDGGMPYSGSASIDRTENDLVLKRRRGEREITATGRFEVPSPPRRGPRPALPLA